MGQAVRMLREKPTRKFLDVVKEKIKLSGVRKEDAEERG